MTLPRFRLVGLASSGVLFAHAALETSIKAVTRSHMLHVLYDIHLKDYG